jgi:hypothetical protein
VIADPDQAIYGFRGAGASFTRFGADHPTARAVRLGRNYEGHQGRAAAGDRQGEGRPAGAGGYGAAAKVSDGDNWHPFGGGRNIETPGSERATILVAEIGVHYAARP